MAFVLSLFDFQLMIFRIAKNTTKNIAAVPPIINTMAPASLPSHEREQESPAKKYIAISPRAIKRIMARAWPGLSGSLPDLVSCQADLIVFLIAFHLARIPVLFFFL